MTYTERNEILMDSVYLAQVRIALCDWLNYWAINGTDTIEDQDLRTKTDMFIGTALSNIEASVKRIAILIIGESVVKEADEVTDAIIQTALTTVMSHAIDRLL